MTVTKHTAVYLTDGGYTAPGKTTWKVQRVVSLAEVMEFLLNGTPILATRVPPRVPEVGNHVPRRKKLRVRGRRLKEDEAVTGPEASAVGSGFSARQHQVANVTGLIHKTAS